MSILDFIWWCFVYVICGVPYLRYVIDSETLDLKVSGLTRGLIIGIGFVLLNLVAGEVQDAWNALPFHTYEG